MLNSSERHRRLSLEFANRSELIISLESIIAISGITVALSGNLLVCAAVYKNRNLRTRQNAYIVNLAISDLLMAMFVMPVSLGAITSGRWPYSNTLCQMQGFVAVMACIVSLETMTLIAVHRYFKVVHPRLYNKIFKKSTVVASVVIAWVIALATQTHRVARFDFIFHPGKVVCFFKFNGRRYFIFLISAALLIQAPLLIIAFCYYKVHRKVSNHKTKSFRNNSTLNKVKSVSEIKVNRLLFAVVVSFALCWVIPFNVVDLSVLYFGQLALPKFVFVAYSFLICLSSCINPILYNALSREFRAEFKRLIACGRMRRSRRVSQVSQVKASVITHEGFDCTEKTSSLEICKQSSVD